MPNTPLQQVPDFNQLEIIKVAFGATPSCTVTNGAAGWGTNTTTNTYAHNLGFTPLVLGYIASGTTYVPMNFPRSETNFAAFISYYQLVAQILADSTNVYIKENVSMLTTSSGSLVVQSNNVKYFLLRPTAT